MAKTLKTQSGKHLAPIEPGATEVVRNAKTGKSVTVKGVGALKGDSPKIRKGINLLKPIAEQALLQRSEKRKAG
jgi:hypothetical protein